MVSMNGKLSSSTIPPLNSPDEANDLGDRDDQGQQCALQVETGVQRGEQSGQVGGREEYSIFVHQALEVCHRTVQEEEAHQDENAAQREEQRELSGFEHKHWR